ncbi:MAG: type 4a pilus biogenesis protein PilO [Sulfuricellaceae bacterium]
MGNWPTAPKAVALIALFVVLLLAGYWFDWSDQLNQLDAATHKEDALKTTFMDKKKQAVNLETHRQQLKDLEQAFGALLKQLPNKSEMDALLTDINQAGLGRGLEFELFKPDAKEIFSEFYAELPIAIRVTGKYHDLGAFASDVSLLPRIVTLNDIGVTFKDGVLVMDAVAKTYRYLDDDETAAQRKLAKEKADKTKPPQGGKK